MSFLSEQVIEFTSGSGGSGDTDRGMRVNLNRPDGGRRWTVPGWKITAVSGSVTPSAGFIYYSPIYVARKITFDRLGIQVNTLAAGSTVRMGIYNSDGLTASGLIPTTLVLDAGTVDTSTTGDKEVTISQELEPGWYFMAYYANGGSPACQGASGPQNSFQAYGDSPGDILGNSSVISGFDSGGVWASGLPADASVSGTPNPVPASDADLLVPIYFGDSNS